ncbi:hypothetical protein QR680_007489 [Steinernema hermaphroditum]|uniref:Uncharacterized protein n=1 Tax=Steinernema hermaphroditum TaxID=289476 RepID=A0AA39IEW1_9BILA|nr:hypothetical protein QR680_007489 [Steinernema hermaphroditum]
MAHSSMASTHRFILLAVLIVAASAGVYGPRGYGRWGAYQWPKYGCCQRYNGYDKPVPNYVRYGIVKSGFGTGDEYVNGYDLKLR